ncbi:MAG: hypothetical protein K6B69_05310 [Lachnospiraceae bacterium]|nr:hypothetical protein [Lachnospiraceae bacterium]MBR7076100.1 hypothetical protein [Lachnospiraceae bacterium]MCR5127507.1 hypothetical protein [Lachnospiraceae bacterium]
MDSIIESLVEMINDLLKGMILTNLETMFTDVNTGVTSVADNVAQTPESWNGSVFSMIQTLSNDVIVPVAGIIITAVLCYELISMVTANNGFERDGEETAIFFKFIFKACIAVYLLTNTFDIVCAVFQLGSEIVNDSSSTITGATSIDVASTIQTMFNDQFSSMDTGELFVFAMETFIVKFGMKIMAVCITVVLYSRMIEIYLYMSVAPIPFATLTNREWGTIGTNYVKGITALAFQGFFIMVCVGIYAAIVTDVVSSVDSFTLSSALWQVGAVTIVLCFALFKTGSIARSVFNSH